MTARIAKLVIFRGRVQGVGFRRTTWHLAQNFSVTGYVRNEPDGSVRLQVEGPEDEVSQFLARLQETMKDFIVAVDVSACEPNDHAGFEIAY